MAQQSGRRSSSRKDAIALLKADHRTVEELFKRYKRLGERAVKTKATTIQKICDELEVHAAIEEKHLYPAAEEDVRGTKRMVDHAEKEHDEVKQMVKRLRTMDPSDAETGKLMKELMSSVKDHVKEEETELFPKLKDSLDRAVLLEIGAAMAQMKNDLKKRMEPRRSHAA